MIAYKGILIYNIVVIFLLITSTILFLFGYIPPEKRLDRSNEKSILRYPTWGKAWTYKHVVNIDFNNYTLNNLSYEINAPKFIRVPKPIIYGSQLSRYLQFSFYWTNISPDDINKFNINTSLLTMYRYLFSVKPKFVRYNLAFGAFNEFIILNRDIFLQRESAFIYMINSINHSEHHVLFRLSFIFSIPRDQFLRFNLIDTSNGNEIINTFVLHNNHSLTVTINSSHKYRISIYNPSPKNITFHFRILLHSYSSFQIALYQNLADPETGEEYNRTQLINYLIKKCHLTIPFGRYITRYGLKIFQIRYSYDINYKNLSFRDTFFSPKIIAKGNIIVNRIMFKLGLSRESLEFLIANKAEAVIFSIRIYGIRITLYSGYSGLLGTDFLGRDLFLLTMAKIFYLALVFPLILVVFLVIASIMILATLLTNKILVVYKFLNKIDMILYSFAITAIIFMLSRTIYTPFIKANFLVLLFIQTTVLSAFFSLVHIKDILERIVQIKEKYRETRELYNIPTIYFLRKYILRDIQLNLLYKLLIMTSQIYFVILAMNYILFSSFITISISAPYTQSCILYLRLSLEGFISDLILFIFIGWFIYVGVSLIRMTDQELRFMPFIKYNYLIGKKHKWIWLSYSENKKLPKRKLWMKRY